MASPAPARATESPTSRARILALAALLSALVALIVTVATVGGDDPAPTGQDAQTAMQELAAANGILSDELDALSPGDSPQEALARTRSLAELTRRLDGEVEGSGGLPDQLHAVYRAELDYLDAVGSTLNNPASPLRARIGDRAQALRDVLQVVPGGDHRAIRGGMALIIYSTARAGE